ncbi:hypothetical protein P4V43_05055 [Brevibacillus fortis]|uniref:Uncharacterized protein n=1 Tax=Brevibacillus fortis TaxID=2126352 RepID=A0A2P7VIN3_9BACL|nr:hypothetical protein [Brevibacillus fortis]MED1781188.1 hypothetical protein [Brevibacillus fortis]PSJ99067.1 hypothetical protein C7R93_05440 [Brevibacillus fortis]
MQPFLVKRIRKGSTGASSVERVVRNFHSLLGESSIQKVARHPQSKTVVLPKSKHLMPIDAPVATSMEILAFLKGLVLD